MGLLGAVVGGIKGFVSGGPVGAVQGAVKGAVGTAKTPAIAAKQLPPISTFAGGFDTSRLGLGPGTSVIPTPGFGGTVSRILPGGMSGYTGAPPGYHLNKRYLAFYIAQQRGKPRQDPTTAHQVVNLVVKNRKMNPLNPRALMRANARQHAAVRIMRRTLRGSGYHITRAGFGKKAKRR